LRPEGPTRNFGGARGGGRNAEPSSPQKKLPAFASQLCDRIALARIHRHTHVHNTFKMRPLTEPETKVLFEKLATYCGKGISNLIADPSGGTDRNVFRVQVHISPVHPQAHPMSN
jgi:hypothetical protein